MLSLHLLNMHRQGMSTDKILLGLVVEEIITIILCHVFHEIIWNLSNISGDWSGYY